MNTKKKLKHHFTNKPIVWVPMWGLSKLRKRGGGYAGALEGKALYYDKWYKRALSEETAGKLAELGVNLVILPFSIGGNSKIEKQERDDFQKMTEHLHKFNIVSLPYLQYQNILQEACELPDSEWAVNLDGTRRQFAYWRRTVCQSSKSFVEYFKNLAVDAVSRGADGIWIDNNYLAPCRCRICEKNFRIFLSNERKDLLDLLYFEDFERTEIPPAIPDTIKDPITQAYLEFNCQRNIKIQSDIKHQLEKILPTGLYASNPALFRGANNYAMGVDFYEMAKLNDILYLENKLYPNVKDDFISGNFHGYISLAEMDCATVSGSWKGEVDFDSTTSSSGSGLPELEGEIRRPIFEAITHKNVVGLFWTVRSRFHGICEKPEQLMQMYFEKENINNWMKDALSTVKNITISKKSENIAEVAVFRSHSSHAFAHSTAYASLFCAEEMLLRNKIPYRVLYSEDIDKINNFSVVIIPEVLFMSDEETQFIEKFVKSGGGILVIGDSSLNDEYGFLREDYALQSATGISYFDRPKEVVTKNIGKGKSCFVPVIGKTDKIIPCLRDEHKKPAWTEKEKEIISNLEQINNQGRQIIVKLNGHAGVSLFKENDDIIISLTSYEENPQNQNIEISVRNDLSENITAQWTTCKKESISVKGVKNKNGYIKYKLNDFEQFGCLRIK